jgi:hypothetical protein
LLVFFVGPAVPFLWAFETARQRIARGAACIQDGYGGDDDDDITDADEVDEEAKTLGARPKRREKQTHLQQITESVKQWDAVAVLYKVQWVGILLFFFAVLVGRLVQVILGVLNAYLAGAPLSLTTALFSVSGLVMFLLPPVPGQPIYFTGGLTLVASARPIFGFKLALLYAIVVNFVLKMLAIAMQQKWIGEHMASSKPWVRSFVRINSVQTRAIRRILAQPGMPLGKVACLVGGPDWPVSVLTGILKLKVWSMLLGSIPVIIYVAPMTVAGSFLVLADQPGPWLNLSALILVLPLL